MFCKISLFHPRTHFHPLLLVLVLWTAVATAERPGWQSREVDWRASRGARIRAIHYPADKPPPMLTDRQQFQQRQPRKQIRYAKTATELQTFAQTLPEPIVALVFDSPPIDGFVPFVALSVTDARIDDPLNPYKSDACSVNYLTGDYLTDNPESDYAIAVFDTGASANLISYIDAYRTGIDPDFITNSPVILQGATGQAVAWASQALGIFIDGLDVIEPNGLLPDNSGMAGEYNVSIIVGDPIESPNMPTAVGAPFAIFFTTVFCNNNQLIFTVDNNDVNVPCVRVYDHSDSRIPYYSNKINLELRPTQVSFVQYFPCVEIFPGDCPYGDGAPITPTIIVDGWWTYQGLFFVSSVDLRHKAKSAIDKDGFMFDTGAQVTVINDAIRSRLALNAYDPCFVVSIIDVTGEVVDANGYYIDSLEIVASPEWLTFTNVPVIVLDVASPEGGFLDGVIGTNLFNDLNFLIRGGGLFGMGAPYIRFDPICRIAGDIAPACGDCSVDFLDLDELADHWLEISSEPTWNPRADLAPLSAPDGLIDFRDFAVLAEHWLQPAP